MLTNANFNIRVESIDIKNSDCEKFLEVKFDHQLTFDNHLSDLCKKLVKTFIH